MFSVFLKKVVLKNFFSIELTSGESSVAIESVEQKYARSLKRAAVYMLLSLFPILFLENTVIISVLIPVTMVAGTAWFSISLANMKQKFERFGLELTTNLFEAFSVSLGLLFVLSLASLSSSFWQGFIESLPYQNAWKVGACMLGIWIIGNIVYKIFIGSIKYDINDAMLTGQNEAAERFYRKSLSLLHSVSDTLRAGKDVQVANYYIGVAFYEIFSYVKDIGVVNGKLTSYMEKSNKLVFQPAMTQEKADDIAIDLIETFTSYCRNPKGSESEKSLQAIRDEITCLKNNSDEGQEMKDTRLAITFQEIANLLEGQGETIFSVPGK